MSDEPRRRDGDGTGGLRDGSTTFEELREQAIALRRAGLSRRQIRDRPKVNDNDILNRPLEGAPARCKARHSRSTPRRPRDRTRQTPTEAAS